MCLSMEDAPCRETNNIKRDIGTGIDGVSLMSLTICVRLAGVAAISALSSDWQAR